MDTENTREDCIKPGRKPSTNPTVSQLRTLQKIREFMNDQGMPPTMSDLGQLLGITTASVHDQIDQLVRKGYIKRLPGKARGITINEEPLGKPITLIALPIVGCVAAGVPILAEENIIGEINVESSILSSGKFFGLKVKGDSMIDADINDGDIVIVRVQPLAETGTVVVALLGDEATVKRLYFNDDVVELRPQNPRLRPILVGPDDDMRIVGKVIGVRRPRLT